jgi:hypothetical protein
MAIDTEAKRLSVIDVGSPWRVSFPIPDGTIAAADRTVIAKLYSGFTTILVANNCRTVSPFGGETPSPFGGETVTVRC